MSKEHNFKFTATFGAAEGAGSVKTAVPGAIKNAEAAATILRDGYKGRYSNLRRVAATITFLSNMGDPPLSPIRLLGGNVEWAPVPPKPAKRTRRPK